MWPDFTRGGLPPSIPHQTHPGLLPGLSRERLTCVLMDHPGFSLPPSLGIVIFEFMVGMSKGTGCVCRESSRGRKLDP